MRLRTVVGGVVVMPLLASVVLVGSAPAANASEPKISGGGVKTGSTARVTANGGKVLGVPRKARLMLRGHEVASGKGPISYTFSTHSVSNGAYKVTLQTSGAGLLWATRGHTTLHLRAAPYTPSGVTAHRSGHSVTVHWKRGPEPDLTSYRVLSSGGPDVRRSADAACSGSSCAAKLRLPAGGSGRYGFAVRAYRSSGSGGTVASSASNTRYVSLPASKRSRMGTGSRTAPGRGHGGGHTPASSAYPTTTGPAGDYLPRGLGGQNPYLPRSTTQSPFKLPSVGPSGFSYPTPDKPQVAPPPGGRKHVAEPSPVAQKSPIGVGVAAGLACLLVLAHLAARWRLRLVAERAHAEADARAEAKARGKGGGHAWSSATAWSRRAARRLKRIYHREHRQH